MPLLAKLLLCAKNIGSIIAGDLPCQPSGLLLVYGVCLALQCYSGVAAQPLNDHFSNRIVLSGPYAIGTSSTFNATVEPGEPDSLFSSRTVWWTWTAPTSGRVEIRGDDSSFSPVVAVYTGAAFNSLMLVTNGYNPSFKAVRGTAYQLQAAEPWFGRAGPFSLSVALTTAKLTTPTNFTDFRAPASFDIEAMPLASDTSFASVTFLENDVSVGTVTAAPWRLGRVDVPIGYRTYRAVATDAGGITTTSAPVSILVTPAHDDFANRIRLAGASVTLPTLFGPATSEPGETLFPTNFHRVWYSWTAPYSGVARAWTEGPQQPKADVFRGETLQTLSSRLTDHAGLFRIEEGQVYHIGLGGWVDWCGWCPLGENVPAQTILRIEAYRPSVNEHFANRLPLAGNSVTVLASNFTFAALEPQERRHANYGAGRSVWWTWTAPESGVVSIRTTGNTFTTAVAAYAGTELATLTELAAGAYAPVGFYAYAGSNYQIAVDVYADFVNLDYGFFNLRLDLATMPRAPNDDFANRALLASGSVTIDGSNAAATREPGEPLHRGYPGQRSLWYAWTAPGFGQLRVSASSVSFAPIVGVYTGSSLDVLTTPTGSGFERSYTLIVQPGIQYQIAIDGVAGGNGPFQLALLYLPPPNNDNFANRLPIQDFPAIREGTNTFATTEAGEPPHAPPNFDLGYSVWWTWTAPFNGTVTADVRVPPEQASYWKILGVYTGSAVDALTPVATGAPSVTWQAQQGVAYQIAVDGYYSRFTLRLLAPPANDNFADRIPLTGASNLITGSNLGATLEPGEPNSTALDPGGRSVWWTWTAPEDGEAQLAVSNYNAPWGFLQPLLGIYTGASQRDLSLVASNSHGAVRFLVRAGFSYHLQVDGSFGSSTEFTLFLRVLPPAPPLSFDLGNVRRLPDGRMQLPIIGRAEDSIIVEASSDMHTWEEIARQELVGSSWEFIDAPPADQSQRFYRLRNWSAEFGY